MQEDTARRIARRALAEMTVAPWACFMVGAAMHHRSLAEFFTFRLHHEPAPAERVVPALMARADASPFHHPHVLIYLVLPFVLAGTLAVARLLFSRAPALAMLGAALTTCGTLFLAGLFGAWTSFPAIAHVPAEEVTGAIEAWRALTAD